MRTLVPLGVAGPVPSFAGSSRSHRLSPQTPTAKGWSVHESPGHPKSRLPHAAKAFAPHAELPRLRVHCPATLQTFAFSLPNSSLTTLASCETCFGVRSVFSSRRRHTRLQGDWSSDVCSSD